MFERLFAMLMVGVIFWIAFQGGALSVCAVVCICLIIAMIGDEAKKDFDEEVRQKSKKLAKPTRVG